MLSSKEKIIYSCIVVCAVAFGMYILREGKLAKNSPKVITYKDISSEKTKTMTQDKINKQKVEMTNWQTAPQLKGNIQELKNNLDEPNNNELKLESQKNHAAIDAADSTASAYEAPVSSLENQINKQLVNDQEAAQMSSLQKKKFIETYKKRAKDMGYDVELNDKLQLVKAAKIPPKPDYFDKSPASVNDVESFEAEDFDEESQ